MIDQDKMRALAAKLRDEYEARISITSSRYRGAVSKVPLQAANAIDLLLAEVEGHRAARIAYANEFAPDAEGLPDTGNIHANIRKLKAELKAAAADKRRLSLELAGVIIDVEQGHGFDDVCLATIKRIEAALAQRQGEGS